MILPTDTIVAVADGEKLNLFRNTGTETELSLAAAPEEDVKAASGSGGHNNSSANPDQSQAEENGFASGIVGMLNSQVLTNKFSYRDHCRAQDARRDAQALSQKVGRSPRR